MSDPISRRLVLPDPVLLEIRGPDAVRYLNGQITQDARLVKEGATALNACVTDAKGKLQFRVLIHGRPEGVLRISCDHEDADGLLARLDRYLIADDAELEDISGSWRRVHVTGAEPVPEDGAYTVRANRLGVDGWDVWIPSESESAVEGLEAWSDEAAETQRVIAGIPAWGSELTAGMLPPEAGLERTDISYSKGCYIGQEVISRIKSAGKVNRRLTKLEIDASVSCSAGDLLADAEGREAGVITSVAPSAEAGKRALLGYVKRSAGDAPVFLSKDAAVAVGVRS